MTLAINILSFTGNLFFLRLGVPDSSRPGRFGDHHVAARELVDGRSLLKVGATKSSPEELCVMP
jgi:hypothetical protein